MAHVNIDGYRNTATDEVLEVDAEQWGLHGPAHTRWVEKHVYWVLPLGTLFLLTLLFLVFFWGFGGSFRGVWGTAFTQRTGQVWTPVQQASAPAQVRRRIVVPPQGTMQTPLHIQMDVTVRNITAPPSAPAPSRELTPEERAEKLKQELRRQYGVQ